MKRCTTCHSTNVRRSGAHPTEASQHPFRSPYRCIDCGARFWVISRRTRLGAAAGGVLALAIVIAIAVPTLGRLSAERINATSNASTASTNDAAAESVTQQTVDRILRAQSDAATRQSQPIPIESAPR